MITPMKICVVFISLFLLNTASIATPALFFESPVEQAALVELFTSEGCSSCPPADQWVGELKNDPGLWRSFVPVQFHVDYWDYLGWKDKFALKRYSIRQRIYASEWGAHSVYTPGFVLNGVEWRAWGRAAPSLSDRKVGRLRVKGLAPHEYLIEFDPADPGVKAWDAHVALLGMNLSSDVKAGENRGKLLRHDFVVLGVRTEKMEPRSTRFTVIMRSGLDTTIEPEERALAVWVTKAGDIMPVQAAGGFFSSP